MTSEATLMKRLGEAVYSLYSQENIRKATGDQVKKAVGMLKWLIVNCDSVITSVKIEDRLFEDEEGDFQNLTTVIICERDCDGIEGFEYITPDGKLRH